MKYNLNDYVTLTDFNNKDLKNQLEKEGLEIYFNNNLYSIGFNLEKIKRMLLNGEKIDKFDYKRYKADIDVFLKQNNKELVTHIADPMHGTIVVDFYSAENINQNIYGKTSITLKEYEMLTPEQKQDYEENPFDVDDILYIKSKFYKEYTKLQLYKLLKAQSSRDAIKLLDDTDVKEKLNSIEVKTRNNLLHIAVQNGLSNVAIKMLDKGADPNIQNRDGNTPLHIAVQNGLNNVAIKMLDKGADPNRQNSDGNTPLSIAIQNGLTSVVNKINGNNKGGSIKKKGQRKISVNNIMAKSRRNVSRRKRQQKRRNSRRNFRKMSGGGIISDASDAKTKLSDAMETDIVYKSRSKEQKKILLDKTITKLNTINDFGEYPDIIEENKQGVLNKNFVNSFLNLVDDPVKKKREDAEAAQKEAEAKYNAWLAQEKAEEQEKKAKYNVWLEEQKVLLAEKAENDLRYNMQQNPNFYKNSYIPGSYANSF